MTFDIVLKLLGVVSPIIAILTFIIGQRNGVKRNSYEEGVKDANIKNSIDNLATKIEEYAKNTVQREEFLDVKKDVEYLKKQIVGVVHGA